MNISTEEFNTKIIARIRKLMNLSEDSLATVRYSLLFANDGNGRKIDLKRLSEFEDGDFLHDVVGIDNHASRKHDSCGALMDGFVPRCGFEV